MKNYEMNLTTDAIHFSISYLLCPKPCIKINRYYICTNRGDSKKERATNYMDTYKSKAQLLYPNHKITNQNKSNQKKIAKQIIII